MRVSDIKRTKLEDKIFKAILLGVCEESKSYRPFDPIAKKVVTSRDVVFDESSCCDWSEKETDLEVLTWGENEEQESTAEDEGDSEADEE